MTTRIILRRATKPGLLVALVLAAAGCSSSPEQPAAPVDQLVDKAGVTEEYNSTVAELEWPPGTTPPERPDSLAGASYQVGVGASDAVMAWNCAWGRAWLDARDSDPAAAEHALVVYASIVDRPEFQEHFDPESFQPFLQGIIEDARLGDPSGVQRDVSVNCPPDES